MNNPTTEDKIKQYEEFLHNINLMLIFGSSERIKKLLENADNWSYAHRAGNGEMSEEDQQEYINRAFWKLNDLDLTKHTLN
jgi:hypothetical protein